MEMLNGGYVEWPYLRQGYDFRQGSYWPDDRPGIGVDVDTSKLQLIGEFTERYAAIPIVRRPDGSYTN